MVNEYIKLVASKALLMLKIGDQRGYFKNDPVFRNNLQELIEVEKSMFPDTELHLDDSPIFCNPGLEEAHLRKKADLITQVGFTKEDMKR